MIINASNIKSDILGIFISMSRAFAIELDTLSTNMPKNVPNETAKTGTIKSTNLTHFVTE